jgi:hypothetical protein
MICANCRCENRDGAVFCTGCGSKLAAAGDVAMNPADLPLIRSADKPQRLHTRKVAQGRNPFIAMLASFVFFAGGQIYNGDYKKMLAVWAVYVVLAVVAFSGIAALPAAIGAFATWAWAIVDAYGVAKGTKGLW